MATHYEWDVEEVASNGDIEEHNHVESYAQARRLADYLNGTGQRADVVLVRDDDRKRAWAYIENGVLPESFEDAMGAAYYKVPKAYHTEVAAWSAAE